LIEVQGDEQKYLETRSLPVEKYFFEVNEEIQ